MRAYPILFVVALGLAPTEVSAEQPASSGIAFDHIALYVNDIEKSVAFYKDMFDLRQVPAPVPFARWLAFGNGMMLHIVGGRPAPVENGKWDHFAITCDNLKTFIERLNAKGIAWSDIQGRPNPQTDIRGKGIKQIFIKDPDGYWIEVNDAQTMEKGRR